MGRSEGVRGRRKRRDNKKHYLWKVSVRVLITTHARTNKEAKLCRPTVRSTSQIVSGEILSLLSKPLNAATTT
ncbi:hypothetical protein BS47DRAFT_153254 [Hydnum rufescens UP504]|uniref:Uncharacterized protein n=1 Tax=Hydnum rufescens UP504 TaxID=1448309 RepID=A0A9P6DNV2_9AGAM|nr:hypothetical protein BS47DRAFT_153254 [Hydnum rufescens UP504]